MVQAMAQACCVALKGYKLSYHNAATIIAFISILWQLQGVDGSGHGISLGICCSCRSEDEGSGLNGQVGHQ